MNHDNIPDIIEVDEDDRIRSYNGYTIRPSKQGLYNEYYSQDQNKAVADHNGRPVYPNKFKTWYQFTSNNLGDDQRKMLNKELTSRGMLGYKVKNITLNEMVKSTFAYKDNQYGGASLYDVCMDTLSRAVGIDVKVVKRSLPISSLSGQIVRAALFVHFGVAPSTNQATEELNREVDDKVVGRLARIVNSKKYGLKDDMIAYLLQGIHLDAFIHPLVNAIWANLVIQKSYTRTQATLVVSFMNHISNDLATRCQQALVAANQASEIIRQGKAVDRGFKINPMKTFNGL